MVDQERVTLSIEEAAGILGISRAHAYELVRRGYFLGSSSAVVS